MNILEYFQPVDFTLLQDGATNSAEQLGQVIETRIEELENYDLVLFDVEEERGTVENKGCSKGGNLIRSYLYQLYKEDYTYKVADLGTIKQGESITDTYFAVQDVVSMLLRKNIIPIILGGSQDLVYANYLAYVKEEQTVNLVSIDSKFALGNTDDSITAGNYFSKIILHQPNALFNFSNLGYQTYFVNQKELQLLNDLFFDSHRIGILKENIRAAEPIIRNADFINFSLNAVAQPYAPANKTTSPNGFNGEQACQLAKYAGMSDKLTSFGIYDFNPEVFDHGQTAHLVAQMIWYFIDGFYNRKADFPKTSKKDYVKYTVHLEEEAQEIIFYKSPKSDRWWMNVPYHFSFRKKYERHLMLPCDYKDYLTATENELPERWFQTFQKLK